MPPEPRLRIGATARTVARAAATSRYLPSILSFRIVLRASVSPWFFLGEQGQLADEIGQERLCRQTTNELTTEAVGNLGG